ncbi:MAG: reverse transcriptase/maturase family protein, partial [Patescibacteria group bacterium]
SGGGHHSNDFYGVISIENLLHAWRKFSEGKRSNNEVAKFELHLEENLFSMHERLMDDVWKNDPYVRCRISDPKPRIIHIASVRDRVLFQAVYQKLYQIFDKTLIHDSYASRRSKGTHAGVRRFEIFSRKVSANYTQNAFVLKCDIRKFFDNIDHSILFSLISKRLKDEKLLVLIHKIIWSFETTPNKGLPLGNVTSQIFSNIYLNKLDQFTKHTLKVKYYIRYCDDFVILNRSSNVLKVLIEKIRDFLRIELLLELHPRKVTIRKLQQGNDFLGYVSLPYYRILRTKTKRRMLKQLIMLAKSIKSKNDFLSALPVIQSYLGMLSHCQSFKIKRELSDLFKRWK